MVDGLGYIFGTCGKKNILVYNKSSLITSHLQYIISGLNLCTPSNNDWKKVCNFYYDFSYLLHCYADTHTFSLNLFPADKFIPEC
jgi:hypothetical protein